MQRESLKLQPEDFKALEQQAKETKSFYPPKSKKPSWRTMIKRLARGEIVPVVKGKGKV